MNLITFPWFIFHFLVLFLLFRRLCFFLLDRAAARHSSGDAELRQYPELEREIEQNYTEKPDCTVHKLLPFLSV